MINYLFFFCWQLISLSVSKQYIEVIIKKLTFQLFKKEFFFTTCLQPNIEIWLTEFIFLVNNFSS